MPAPPPMSDASDPTYYTTVFVTEPIIASCL